MVARLSTGQDRYTIWQGLVGSQTAEEFWTESQEQGATTYREAAERYVEYLRETQGLVSEAGWPEEDVPVLVDMLVEVLEEELGPQAPSSITWQVIEDNGGGLHLMVFDGDRVIYYGHGYEHNEDGLRTDLAALRNGDDPRDGWEMLTENPQDSSSALLGHETGWTVVADQDGVYYDRMGAAAQRVFGIGEVVPRPGRLLREWRGYRIHAENADEDPNVLVIVDQDGNMAWFDAGLREWEDFDDLLALLVDDMDAGRLQWYEGE